MMRLSVGLTSIDEPTLNSSELASSGIPDQEVRDLFWRGRKAVCNRAIEIHKRRTLRHRRRFTCS